MMIALRTLFLFAFLALAAIAPAMADGRADWTGYAWQKIDIATCEPSTPGLLTCPLFHQKWDWKRNQWVDIAIVIDQPGASLHLVQRLTDNDRSDDDYVCVTAIVVDADGRNLVAHHQNWHMGPGQVLKQSFVYKSAALATARTVHIGSKQCREGARQDDKLYAGVLAGIGH